MDYFEYLVQLNSGQWGSVGFIMVLLLAYVVTFFYLRGNETRYSYVWYTGLMMVLLVNPLTFWIMRMVIPEREVVEKIQRSFSILPISFIIAIAITLGMMYFKKPFFRWGLGIMSIAVVALFGGVVYSQRVTQFSTNSQKVPNAVLEASAYLDETNKTSASILAGEKILPYLRQVDLRFNLKLSGDDERLKKLKLDSEKSEVEQAVATTEEYGLDYMMIYSSPLNQEALEKYDYLLRDNLSGYDLYERTVSANRWIVTTYQDASEKPGSGYVLYNRRSKQLIIIDGGSTANTEAVREHIELLGGHVSAWYITNYSSEHAGVIVDILKNPGDIVVDHVYDNGISLDNFKLSAGEWNDMIFFEEYVNTVRPYVKSDLYRGRKLMYTGLSIEIINTYDNLLLDWTKDDILANASLMLKITSKSSSILYCSDVHSASVAKQIISRNGFGLRSEYLVVPNHGDRSIPSNTAFYSIVSPKVAYFDTPQSYLETDDHSVAELWNYLKDRRKVECRLSGDKWVML